MTEHNYLFRAKDAQRRAVTDQVMATSAEHAVQKLLESGYTDIELFTDDVYSRAGEDPKRAEAIRRGVRPDIQIRLHSATPIQARWLAIVNAYRQSALIGVILAIIFILRRFNLSHFAWFDYGFLVTLALPIVLVLFLARSGDMHRQLQRAFVEGRFQDVLKLSVKLEPIMRKGGGQHILNLTAQRANALVMLGQTDAALAEMERVHETPGLSEAAYQVQLANVFLGALDLQRARHHFEEAIRIEPDQPGGWLGLAELLATRLCETTEAKAALERLNGFTLTADTRKALSYIEGAIALNEQRYIEARHLLETSHADLMQRARATPIAIGTQRLAEALLTLACVGAGDRQAAEGYFAACADFLRLHQVNDMLDRCESALAS